MENIAAWKVIFLGVVQGLTEFLPVSSSAHLVVFQQWLGLAKEASFLLAFDVALHFGTLAAVLLAFREDLKQIAFSFVRHDPPSKKLHQKLGIYLLIGTIPAAFLGMGLRDFFALFFADTLSTSFFLIITGWVLWLTRFATKANIDLTSMKQKHAWFIGLSQAIAIFPGISRSGSTIACGLFLGLTPQAAVRFSFLLSVPAVAGASLLELKHLVFFKTSVLLPVFVGVLASFAVGYASIRWMLRLVADKKLHQFAWYCWGFAITVFITEMFF